MPIPPVQGATGPEAATPPPCFARCPRAWERARSRPVHPENHDLAASVHGAWVYIQAPFDERPTPDETASMPAFSSPRPSSPSPSADPFFLVGQDVGGYWLAVETHVRGWRASHLARRRPRLRPARGRHRCASVPDRRSADRSGLSGAGTLTGRHGGLTRIGDCPSRADVRGCASRSLRGGEIPRLRDQPPAEAFRLRHADRARLARSRRRR